MLFFASSCLAIVAIFYKDKYLPELYLIGAEVLVGRALTLHVPKPVQFPAIPYGSVSNARNNRRTGVTPEYTGSGTHTKLYPVIPGKHNCWQFLFSVVSVCAFPYFSHFLSSSGITFVIRICTVKSINATPIQRKNTQEKEFQEFINMFSLWEPCELNNPYQTPSTLDSSHN